MANEQSTIPFHRPFFTNNAFGLLSGFTESGGSLLTREYTNLCTQFLSNHHNTAKVYLTKSCTQALELSSLLLSVEPGDEIIMPSFAYVSCATAFILRGCTCRFVDIDPNTMNISPEAVANAISSRTKAVVVINYAGIACDYENLRAIIAGTGIYLVEDNAMGIAAWYKDKPLGTIGDIGVVSFDYLKNVTCGEGGAIILNTTAFDESIKTIYENGTNKIDFINGVVDKYEWKSIGSNYYLSEVLACILYKQLEFMQVLTQERLKKWEYYQTAFNDLQQRNHIELLQVPDYCKHNGHAFVIKVKDGKVRTALQKHLKERKIETAFHYTPLHKSEFGIKSGVFIGEDKYTTNNSQRMLRLPLYFSISASEQEKVVHEVSTFFA